MVWNEKKKDESQEMYFKVLFLFSVEALKKNTYYNLIDEDDPRIEMFWAAIKNFSNEDRSHLLKFITGRRRLPVSIFIAAGKKWETHMFFPIHSFVLLVWAIVVSNS